MSKVRVSEPPISNPVAGRRVISAGILSTTLAAWGCLLVAMFGYLVWYSNAPGLPAAAPSRWPVGSAIDTDGERPTLVMFIHPKCPCTQSSLEELARIVARCTDLVEVIAVFVRPAGVPEGWEGGDNWRSAAAIPGVRMIVDIGGNEARRFGATTSGHVQLYDAEGNLSFSGGITGARNHAGDNLGSHAVKSWVLRGTGDHRESFVFGCPLLDSPPD